MKSISVIKRRSFNDQSIRRAHITQHTELYNSTEKVYNYTLVFIEIPITARVCTTPKFTSFEDRIFDTASHVEFRGLDPNPFPSFPHGITVVCFNHSIFKISGHLEVFELKLLDLITKI